MEINTSVAIVTGAASGMGAATASMLASEGAKVVLVDNNLKACEQKANEIGGHPIQCDVTSADAVQKVTDLAQKLGTLRICINCAGIVSARRVVSKEGAMPLDEFSKVINVNLIGTFNVLRLASEVMSKNEALADEQRGVIINTASVAAFEGQIGQAAYSASKGGVVALTLPIARELARFGIRIMTIAPGLVETPMLASLPEKARAQLIAGMVFPKRFAKPTEFAQLAKHIITHNYLNGETIRMDGGLRLS